MHLLIAEDDEYIASAAKRHLEKQGYTVAIAADGPSVLRSLEEETPDLLILDILMPEMDGYAVLQALRDPDGTLPCPVIVLTNVSEEEGKEHCQHLGAAGYYKKSTTSLPDLVLLVQRHLNTSH